MEQHIPQISTGNTLLQPTVSDYTSLQRKKWVLDQYLLGRYPYQIREEYCAMYIVSSSSYDKDVAWANAQLVKKGERDIDAIIDKHTDYYYDNYRVAKEKGDIKAANDSLKKIEDLYKIHGGKGSTGMNIQVNNTSTNLSIPNLSVDEIRELLGGKPSTGYINIPNE